MLFELNSTLWTRTYMLVFLRSGSNPFWIHTVDTDLYASFLEIRSGSILDPYCGHGSVCWFS